LVDDDEAVRTTLARMLALSGYPVREYSSGAELLAAAEGLSGCILLDLNMPDANGIAVNKALKELSIDIPVSLMTGAGDLGNLPIRPDVGAILQKPFRRTDLMSLLGKFGIRPNAEAKRP
jgi:two-component system response regulator FixJ